MANSEKAKERQRLANLISQWNLDHYDIFELSQPDENCQFHGVVRFYFQDGINVVTKCIRVASTATTKEVIDVLVEKFRPDMRMLTFDKYLLYEVHANEERQLADDERILYAQLNWGKDVREGRFLLKRAGDATVQPDKENQGNFKRKLSKREKKEKKKQEKEKKATGIAEKLYQDMPESKFTRSISNPDAVMRRRRQQKVEKKLQECKGQDGQGGTLKIYGETLKPDVPYKTLLLSTGDNVQYVIKEAMEKYGLEKEDPDDFCLKQVLVAPNQREYHGGAIGEERIMEDHECPLAIAMEFPPAKGTLMFHLVRIDPERRTKHKKLKAVSHTDLRPGREEPPPALREPYLVELQPDGSDNPNGRVHRLHMTFTEIGSDRNLPILAQGPNIQPRHCVIGLSPNDGITTITPTREAETYVNSQRIYETTTLQHGMTVRLGKLNYFKFIDPNFEDRMRKVPGMPTEGMIKRGQQYQSQPLETNLDVDDRMESLGPAQKSRALSQADMHRGHQQASPDSFVHQREGDDRLPAILEFRTDKEEQFWYSLILDNNSDTQFKLAPTYTIYMAVRFILSNKYHPEMNPGDRASRVPNHLSKISKYILEAIQSNADNPASLAFWMANASEVLHFFKQDHDIHPFSQEAQELLAESVQLAFHQLVDCLQYDLSKQMPAFLDESDMAEQELSEQQKYNTDKPLLSDVLDVLSSAMNLLRRCRVNAALTIQLFSQLFHFINMWLFNTLVTKQHPFCTRSWGIRLKRRLGRVEAWAEKQGLELAADCHLCRIIQVAHLLQAPKSSKDDITNITSTCFKLNSLQIRELLMRYIPERGEPPIPQNLIENIVNIAQNMADDLIKKDGREVQLQEDQDLQLPFLLPEDGYSCDTVKSIPNGLIEFIDPLARAGLCTLIPVPSSRGDWTVYMTSDDEQIDEAVQRGHSMSPNQQQGQGDMRVQPLLPKEPEIMTVTFNKVKGSMGLSIVAAKGEGQKERGIYIKSVVPGGAAALDKRLQAGDQLLEVDGKSLVGLSQEKAAQLMTRTGHTVTLKVAKQGAFYHGLANLLSQPSPVLPRAASPKKPASPLGNKPRPNEEAPPPYNGTPEMDRSRTLPGHRDLRQMGPANSRSSPSLNKYRRGVSHKDMENIYSRDALWRIILESDLREVTSKSDQKHLASLKKDNDVRPRSRSFTSHSETNGNLEDPEVWKKKQRDLRDLQFELKSFSENENSLSPSAVKGHLRSKSVTNIDDIERDSYFYNGLPPRHRKQKRKKNTPRSKSNPNIPNMDLGMDVNSHRPNHANNALAQKNAFITPESTSTRNYSQRPKSLSSVDPNNNPTFPNYVNINHINGYGKPHVAAFDHSLSSSSPNSSRSYGSAVFSASVGDFPSSYISETSSRSQYHPVGHYNNIGPNPNREFVPQQRIGPPPPPRRSYPPPYKSSTLGSSSRHSSDSVFLDNNSRRSNVPNMNGVTLQSNVYNSSKMAGFNGNPRGNNFLTRNPRSKALTTNSLPRDMGSDRGRPQGPMRDQQGPMPHQMMGGPDRMQPRDPRDPAMSKSIPNLRMDHSFEQRDPHGQHSPAQMRPAQSVGALQHGEQFHDYYNHTMERSPNPRGNDYENQHNLDPRLQRSQPNLQQVNPDMGYGRQFDRGGPPSSRNSQSSFRDDRPQSAYYGQQDRPGREERPRSMEINASKIHEWQQKNSTMDGPPHHSPQDNYINTRSQPGNPNMPYANQNDFPKVSANNEMRQPNFYENTSPRQNELPPAFHQLKKPQIDAPPVAPKPSVAPKPMNKVPIQDVPRIEIDNRQTQPSFYNPRLQQEHSPKPVSMSQSSYMQGQPHMVHSHDPRVNSLGRNIKQSPARDMYHPHHQSPELPPPPADIPPELPPPPVIEDDLPPLPPPPSNDYRLDHHDPPYANQGEARLNMQQTYPQSFNSMSHPVHFQPKGPGQDQRLLGYAEPQRHPPPQQQPPAKPQHTLAQPYHPSHDYQNISYEGRSPNRSFESQPPQQQHSPHMYEPFEKKSSFPVSSSQPSYMAGSPSNKAATLPLSTSAAAMNIQQTKNRVVAEMSDVTKKDTRPRQSAWDRDEKEQQEKEMQSRLKRSRDQEIADLESRSYLSPDESKRLSKLRLEQEFQRRVEEMDGLEDNEEESDIDITDTNTQSGRDFLIKTVQEDIAKTKQRVEEYNRRRQYEEKERERERLQALQRKLEIYEREKEERMEKARKREERKKQEQEEQLRKQREQRDRQRQEYEEQKKLMIAEEEKFRQKKMEEMERQRELEREQRRRIQEQKDAEERRLRAEARQREEEYRKQELERKERERREQEREIRVREERQRLETMQQNYQPYANLPSHYPDHGASVPPPPQRGSSYDIATRSNNGIPYNNNNNRIPEPSKKSVKFDTQLETRNTYSVASEEDRTPLPSQSSYRSSQSSDPSSPMRGPGDNAVFNTPDINIQPERYRVSENTPSVIGAQEVYRDPRSRINAQKEAQQGMNAKKPQDKMSFKDKMKFFAQEAGEDTPKYKPKASKTLRNIENQLHNGQ